MKGRRSALGLLLASLLVHLTLGRPAEREAVRAQEDAARLRKERRALTARLVRLDREREQGARAARMELPASAPVDGVARLRLALLDALAGQPVSGVRLSVAPGQGPRAAEGRVRAEGAFADLVRLSGRLVAPGRGFVLRRVRFAATTQADGGLTLEIEGFSVSPGRAVTVRWLGTALLVVLAISLVLRACVPRPGTAVPQAPTAQEALEPGSTAPAGPPTVAALTDLLPPPPARDIFRYADASPALTSGGKVEPEPPPVSLAEPPALPPSLRLVGLVRRPEGLRAAVATASGVVIVGPGDVVLGHTVLAVDEDSGLRVRTPDGTEQNLSPAR